MDLVVYEINLESGTIGDKFNISLDGTNLSAGNIYERLCNHGLNSGANTKNTFSYNDSSGKSHVYFGGGCYLRYDSTTGNREYFGQVIINNSKTYPPIFPVRYVTKDNRVMLLSMNSYKTHQYDANGLTYFQLLRGGVIIGAIIPDALLGIGPTPYYTMNFSCPNDSCVEAITLGNDTNTPQYITRFYDRVGFDALLHKICDLFQCPTGATGDFNYTQTANFFHIGRCSGSAPYNFTGIGQITLSSTSGKNWTFCGTINPKVLSGVHGDWLEFSIYGDCGASANPLYLALVKASDLNTPLDIMTSGKYIVAMECRAYGIYTRGNALAQAAKTVGINLNQSFHVRYNVKTKQVKFYFGYYNASVNIWTGVPDSTLTEPPQIVLVGGNSLGVYLGSGQEVSTCPVKTHWYFNEG
jgi:hypothetical protein